MQALTAGIGVARALVSPYSPVFSALGYRFRRRALTIRNRRRCSRRFLPMELRRRWTLERRALDDLGKSDVKTGECDAAAFHQHAFPLSGARDRRPGSPGLTLPGAVDRLVEDFVALYERNFGAGNRSARSRRRDADLSRSSAVSTPKPALQKFPCAGSDPSCALSGERPVYWKGRLHRDTGILLGTPGAGNRLSGPAVIEAPNTTILIHPEQQGEVDEYLKMVIEF